MWDTIASGQEIFAYVNNRAKNGDNYWVFAHITPSFDANHKIIGFHSNRRLPRREALAKVTPLYAQLLAEAGARIVLWVPQELVRLMRGQAGIAEVVAPFLVDGRLSLKAVIKGGTVMSTKSRGLSSEKLDSECPSPPSTKSKEL